MRRNEVQCREVAQALTDYFEGTLPAEQRTALEEHLVMCEGCTNYVEQLRVAVRLTGRLEEEDVPASVMDTLLLMFKEGSGA